MTRLAVGSLVFAVMALAWVLACVADAALSPPARVCTWSHGIPYYGPNGSVLYTPAPPSPTIECPSYR